LPQAETEPQKYGLFALETGILAAPVIFLSKADYLFSAFQFRSFPKKNRNFSKSVYMKEVIPGL